ncbi:MAG TPA: hypothetical protein H9881_06445 [Candidatus Stackebrandtia excrementipullorum]|nr:hypothetical protein [Candidatus Stackebrandtia excrementipullorum]
MKTFHDRLNSIRIEVTSDDGAIAVTKSNQVDYRIHISEDATKHHNEDSLARAVETAITSAKAGLMESQSKLLSDIQSRGIRIDPTSSPAVRGYAKLLEHLEDIEATGQSGSATVGVYGDGEIAVHLRAESVRKLSEHQLEQDLNSAVVAAFSEYRKQASAVRRRTNLVR